MALYTLNITHAQNLLVNNSQGNLLSFDADGCSTQLAVNIGSYTDIAAHQDGFLYAIKAQGTLYRIDMMTGVNELIHTFGGNQYYALTSDAEGNIFAASGLAALRSYNPATGVETVYPSMGYEASGDLTFYQGQMYMATTDNTIVSIHPENPEDNEVFIDFSSAGATIFGIVSSVNGCEVQTYAFSNNNSARVYQIDWENQSFNFICTIPHQIYGGSSEFEFEASASLIDILDIIVTNDGCDDADSDVEVVAESANSGIVYSLDNENFQTQNTFSNLTAGFYTLYLEDDGGCVGNMEFYVNNDFLQINTVENTPTTCGNDNGSITVEAEAASGLVAYSLNGGNLVQGGNFNNLAVGNYEVLVTDLANCETVLNIEIQEAVLEEVVDVEATGTSCGGINGSALITAAFGEGELSYSLDGISFQASSIFENLASGEYEVSISDESGCSFTSPFFINPSENISTINTEIRAVTCSQNNGSIEVFVEENDSDFEYSLDNINYDVESIFDNLSEGFYTIFVKNENGCFQSTEVIIPASEVSCELYIPNVFSPNDDGINDIFKAYSETDILIERMQIYSRWGELLYQAENISTLSNQGWNGTFKGDDMPEGVYVYVVLFQKGDVAETASGDVTLMR